MIDKILPGSNFVSRREETYGDVLPMDDSRDSDYSDDMPMNKERPEYNLLASNILGEFTVRSIQLKKTGRSNSARDRKERIDMAVAISKAQLSVEEADRLFSATDK